MRTVSNVRLNTLESMSIQDMMEYVEDFGYCVEGLSNDDLYELAVSLMDGHDESDEVQELSFDV